MKDLFPTKFSTSSKSESNLSAFSFTRRYYGLSEIVTKVFRLNRTLINGENGFNFSYIVSSLSYQCFSNNVSINIEAPLSTITTTFNTSIPGISCSKNVIVNISKAWPREYLNFKKKLKIKKKLL